MKVLNVEETIRQGKGMYWWRSWTDRAEGGALPAKTNAPAMCYILNDEVYSLYLDPEVGIGGGRVYWEVEKASQKLAKKVKEIMK